MRKLPIAAVILAAILLLSSCAAPAGVKKDGKLKIVTTIWPVYQWTQAVLGDNPAGAEVTLLIDSGVDPHSFQPAVSDIMELYTCDLLIYTGGDSEQWVGEVLQGEVDPDLVTLPLMASLGDSLCTAEHDHEGHGHDHGHHEETYDEHIWLSLKMARTLCHEIAHELGHVDPANAAVYEANAEQYIARLAELDKAYEEAVADSGHKTLLFADRFPFLYLTEDYGITHYEAFPGCSAETEASFATVMHLAEKVKELGLPAILTIDGGDGSIARTVAESTGREDLEILTLHSMQAKLEERDTYLSVMEENLNVLRRALLGNA